MSLEKIASSVTSRYVGIFQTKCSEKQCIHLGGHLSEISLLEKS